MAENNVGMDANLNNPLAENQNSLDPNVQGNVNANNNSINVNNQLNIQDPHQNNLIAQNNLQNNVNNNPVPVVVKNAELYRKSNLVKIKDENKEIDITNDIIWKGYPFWDRFWYKFCCGNNCITDSPIKTGQGFFIQSLLNRNSQIDPKLQNYFKEKCLYLKIIRSGNLEIQSSIIHPFVRISIVNLKTCRYLQKKNDGPTFTEYDTNSLIENNNEAKTYLFSDSQLSYISPFATAPFDLRERGECYAKWNEEFLINEDAENIWDPNNVMFFELLDFNIDLNVNDDYHEDGISRIAWGYLKLVGFSETYTGEHKIQLYKYKFNRTPKFTTNHNMHMTLEDSRVPDLLYELDWVIKEKYQTFLEIEIRPETRPNVALLRNNSMNIEKFKNSVFVSEGDYSREYFLNDLEKGGKGLQLLSSYEQSPTQKRNCLLKRLRGPNSDCDIPDKLLFKFKTAELGCLTMEFSDNGKFLACACTNFNSLTTIKVFNVEEGTIKYHFKGHQNLIHNFAWNSFNNILISASSDYFLSFWHVPYEDINDSENLKYIDNEVNFKIYSISHPSYVYSVAISYDERECIILASACFDGSVRILQVELSYNEHKDKYAQGLTKHDLIYLINVQSDFEKIDFYGKTIKKVTSSTGMKRKNLSESEKVGQLTRTVLDHRHPNCVVFDETSRLYIGDSLGTIHIWEIRMADGHPLCRKIKNITHLEIEGDAINKITLEPKNKKLLVVHSRDNCIRTIDVNHEKARIISRFYGLKSSKTNIKSTVSPDGNYVISGSEEGNPLLWSFHSATRERSDNFQIGFVDSVSDVCWNIKYNMISISGFGQEYPVLVYIHEAREITEELGEKLLIQENYEIKAAQNQNQEEDNEYRKLTLSESESSQSQVKSNLKSMDRSSHPDERSSKNNNDSSSPIASAHAWQKHR